MKYELLKIDNYEICKVNFVLDEQMIKTAYSQAEAKSPFTNIHNPAAKKRTNLEVFNAQLLGTIADIACSNLLKQYMDKYSPKQFTVQRYDDIRINQYQKPDLFDTEIVCAGNEIKLLEIEIRSSVCNKMPISAMLKKWHILGWYVSQNKLIEEVKDFYMRPIYHYKKFHTSPTYFLKDAIKHLEDGNLDLYIVGGASSDILKEFGEIQQGFGLLQDGATYQVVSIKKGLQIRLLLEEIRNFCVLKERGLDN